MIFGKNYRNLEFEDIERLVSNKISENRTLEYKREINIDKGEERKEFLYDITSFVNSEGGLIIFGISEQKDEKGNNTGLPEEICGIQIDNFDKLILKIEDLLKSSIEPNISNIVIKPLEKANKKILAIGLQKTMGLPRMVTYNSTNKFYRRRNSGKYLVDVYELNQMFMKNTEVIKELESYRRNRLENILKKEYLSNINTENFTLVHVSPINYFRYNQLSLSDDKFLNDLNTKLQPIGAHSWDYRSNFEGYLIFSTNETGNEISAYSQIFRNGIIEFFTHKFHSKINNEGYLFLGMLETHVIDCVTKSLQIYKDQEVSPPFAVHITITDLLYHRINIQDAFRIDSLPFTTNDLLIPNIVINDFDADIEKELKSVFNIIWQSAGCRKSPYYNDIGVRMKK